MLTLTNVTVHYGDLPALSQVSFQVSPGKVLALLGPLGAGKSSLLKTVMGHSCASSGNIRLGSRTLDPLTVMERARAGIFLCPEGGGLFATLTVEENLRVAIPGSWKAARSRLERIVDSFPVVSARWRQKSGTLSGGEKQLVAMARCVLAQPTVALLDEPTTGLAPRAVEAVRQAVGELAAQRTIVVLVEQKTSFALQAADQLLLLRAGHVHASGTPELMRQYLADHPTCLM